MLRKTKNQLAIVSEQNRIKTSDVCIAVYDIPKGCTGSIFVHDYDKPTRNHKLYIYLER